MALREALLPLMLLSAAGCSSYQHGRPLEAIPLPAPPRERFEVWSKGTPHQLHALRMEHDSLAGVPWWKDPGCDSCRVVFARAEVDSVRARHYDPGKTMTATVTGGVAYVLLYPTVFFLLYGLLGGTYD